MILIKISLTMGNILSGQAMKKYFSEFYIRLETDLDYFIPELMKNMADLLSQAKNNYDYYLSYYQNKGQPIPLFIVNSYKTAAEKFKCN